jgi:phage shock protein PspC (stress-responsive transcriptional regulator)
MKRFIKWLFLGNSIVTLPFGILVLLKPAAMFSTFGIPLDLGGQLIARGYGATLVGYGLIFLLMRNTTDARMGKSLLFASFAFNLLEAIIQLAGVIEGTAVAFIWGTILIHLLFAVLSALWIFKLQSAMATK